MLHFAYMEFLWGLAAIPVFFIVFLLVSRWKRRALRSLGEKQVVALLIPEVSFRRPLIKFGCFILAYTLLVVAVADPKIGSRLEEVKQKSADIMILLDVSNSMLAQDMVPNRLESAKRSIAQLIDNLHHDRIGIVVFAGEAFVQLPVTTDYSAAKLFLNTINTDIVPTQGTAIGAAIETGMKSFDFKNGTGKAMIIITDGENHEDDAVSAAKEAASKGVMVNVIGTGSIGGAPVPIIQNGKQVGFHTDSLGKSVVSKLNEEMAREVATAGAGAYVRATQAESGLSIVMDQIAKAQRNAVNSKSFKDFEDRFQYLLVPALLFLLLDFFMANRKNSRWSRINIFEVKNQAMPSSQTKRKRDEVSI